jgi:hypothetical protein
VTDKELRDAAVAELKLTTAGWRKQNGQPNYPSGSAPMTTHWGKAMALLGKIGQQAPSPTPGQIMLPATRAVLEPGQVAAWVVHRSPTTEIMGDGASREKHRVVRWSPDGLYSGRRMVELVGFRMIEGYPGRFHDWHPRPGSPAWARWPAPFAIDFNAGRTGVPKPGMELTLQSEGDEGRPYHFQIMSDAEMRARYGQWTWLWLDNYMARRGVGPGGSCRIYLAGEDTPRVNVSNVNMHWAGEDSIGLSLWEGAYNFSQSQNVIEVAATRIGRDPRECFEDRPTVFVREPAGTPGGTAVALSDVDGGSVPVPAPLRW